MSVKERVETWMLKERPSIDKETIDLQFSKTVPACGCYLLEYQPINNGCSIRIAELSPIFHIAFYQGM